MEFELGVISYPAPCIIFKKCKMSVELNAAGMYIVPVVLFEKESSEPILISLELALSCANPK